jgi:CRISPR-associated protein Cmr6
MSYRFLYRDCKPHFNITNSHAGLWYDKFFDKWQPDASVADEGKQKWIEEVTRRPVGNATQLEQHTTRFRELLNYRKQTPITLMLESDFVTGLGREHPVENGFAWHHTLGTPYLPGSSIKGMVRAWAEQWAKIEGDIPATIKRIFGSEPAKKDVQANPVPSDPALLDEPATAKNQVGSVIFLDAIPPRPVRLKTDIMTPHYSPYYQDGAGQTPPADWHDPTPIPFLVVEKGETFIFGVMPRTRSEKDNADCKTVRGWLIQALAWLGAGAKTAVGYGRFNEKAQQSGGNVSPSDPIINAVKPSSPLEEIVQGLRNTRSRELKTRAQGYVEQLRKADASDEDKRRAAQAMKEILESANLSKLNRLNAYNVLCELAKES